MKKQVIVPWERKFSKPVNVLAILCSAVIVFNMMMLTTDIISRYLFNYAINGCKEIVELLMCYIAYFSIAYACMEETHVEMTAITDRFSPRHKKVNRIIVYGFMTAYFILLTVVTWKVFWDAYTSGEVLRASATIYTAIGKVTMPIGAGVAAIQSGCMMIGAIKRDYRSFCSDQAAISDYDGEGAE